MDNKKVKVKIIKSVFDSDGIPIIAGSVLSMYRDQYDKLKERYPDSVELAFIDKGPIDITKSVDYVPLQVTLEYGEFFNYGNHYQAMFDYSNESQIENMNDYFDSLISSYGVNSTNNLMNGKEALMPYKDELGQRIVGSSIPEYLLISVIKKLIEVDGANIKVGNITINGPIEDELLDTIVHSIKKEKDNKLHK